MAARRSTLIGFVRAGAVVFALSVALAGTLAASEPGRAAFQKPLYTAGDRWVYVLQGSLGALPGLNASQGGAFHLGLTGIVQVDVVGAASGAVGGAQVKTQASGFLNGTFKIPGNATIDVSGTFSSDTTEIWEGRGYLSVASNSSTRYVIDVKAVLSARVTADLWLNSTTSYGSLEAFNLSVGHTASAPFISDLSAATSFSAFGVGQHLENRTSVAGVWTRQVLDQENVTVEAGTFSAYHLNQCLGGFPGFATIAPTGGANETAWLSNDVGYYVKRVAYVNGTPAAEMRLKSYTYPAATSGLSLVDIALLVTMPIAVVAILLFLILRRRKNRSSGAKASSGAGPVGELPPKRERGNP